MTVPATEANYPPPSPPPSTREEVFQLLDFAAVDQRAKQAPPGLVDSFSELVSHLTSGLQTDLEKVRASFVWLSAQQVLTTNFPKVVRPDTPLSYLRRCKLDREVFTDLFALLCRKAGVPCVIIEGSTKGAGWEAGQQELEVANRWNAVHVQGAWRLVNVPWALVTTGDLQQQDGWIMVEEDGRPCRESANADSFVRQDMDEFWFLTDPEKMVCFCFPADPTWQLLSTPWSKEEFTSMPRYAQEMMTSRWELASDSRAVLEAKEGKCKVTFSHPKNVKASLHYNLYFNPRLSNSQLPEQLQLDRYVVEESRLDKRSVITRLPVEGVYRIQLGGTLDEGELTPLVEFRINCVSVREEPPPFPCDNIGFDKTAEDYGLGDPSQEEGVVETRKGEKVDFHFTLKKPLVLKPKLLHNERTPEELSQYIKWTSTKNDVNITVSMPDVRDCALCLDAQTDDAANPYHTLVAYLLTQDTGLTFREEEKRVKAKADLMKALFEGNTTKITDALDAITRLGLDLDPYIRSQIQELRERRRKAPRGKLSALTEAMKGDNLTELMAALAEYKTEENANKQTLQHAAAIVRLLQAMKEENGVGSLEAALSSLLNLKQDDFGHAERARGTLMMHYEKVVRDAYLHRSLPDLEQALESVRRSCLAPDLHREDFYKRAVSLQQHLLKLQRVLQDLGKLTASAIKNLGEVQGRLNPHLQSTLMAVFILLGENEKDLWEWSVIQNLLLRKSDLVRELTNVDYRKISRNLAELADRHVMQCQPDLLLKENGACAALLLEWVRVTTEEKRGRDSMQDHLQQITNSFVSNQ